MSNGENKHNRARREKDRRVIDDRRSEVRFGDVLGRRTGVERRLTIAS